MREEYIEIINRLESLQYDILLWKRREKSKKKQQMLSDYDVYIEKIIDDLYDIGIAE